VRLRIAAVVALALALAGTAGAANRILAVGDFGVGGESERATGAAMKRFEATHPASYLVTLGDNDYTKGRAFAANWQEAFGWLPAAGVKVAGTLGNHDYEAGQSRAELAALGMPGPYYTRKVANAQLFLLDSEMIDDPAQTAWLAQALEASKAAWKIAVFHHPPYSCGFHSGNDDVVAQWVPLFERYGVQLVLSGHEHSYQRFRARRGVTYVVHGGGGAVLYPPTSCPSDHPKRLFSRMGFGFLSVYAGKRRLKVTAIDRQGRSVNSVTLTR
jgi:acid phosphatase